MKMDKVIFWTTTGIVVFVLLFGMYMLYTPAYDKFKMPTYFRTELVIFKIAGMAVLLLPQFPVRMKEWAYAGFGILFISAFIAHYSTGDSFLRSVDPLFFLIMLIISNIYMHKLLIYKQRTSGKEEAGRSILAQGPLA